MEILGLSNNFGLTGTVPSSIFNLSFLLELDFSNNSLTGGFPNDICQRLPQLQGLDMSVNRFTGPIPDNFWQCKELVDISLSFNQFTGRIPRDLGNLTSLKSLYLGSNNLIGEIPHELGNLRNLEYMGLHSNKLVGLVPASIINISTMNELNLFNNTLSGNLPSSIDLTLPNIEYLRLPMNNFSGPIPNFIFNSSMLSVLELGDNSLSGFIPNTFGNLKNLNWLGLMYNDLTSSTPELSFLSSLTSKNLEVIDLTGNALHAILPSSLGNLSISLEKIHLENCYISGGIPEEIGNLINLISLDLEDNKLTGIIPITLGRLQKLQGVRLQNNRLEGSIPEELCHLSKLVLVYLHDNKLSGSIPPCLGSLSSLRDLDLSTNELFSLIRSTFWNLKDILKFNLSSNFLNGSLSLDLENLKVVLNIDMSRNNLSGDIPTTIGGLKNLQVLSLGYNRLQGSIPKSFGDLTSLEYLDLSNNNLYGVIPVSMEKLSYLKHLNLSFNNLEGQIPMGGSFANFSAESFIGNDLLCGSSHLQVSPCTHRKSSRKNVLLLGIMLPLSITVIIIVILAIRFVFIKYSKRSKRLSSIEVHLSPLAPWRRFSYQELLRATDGFSEKHLLGIGSFGSVYKARLQDRMEVAVKVFHLQCEWALESFDVDCEVMKSIRHSNLVKIISSCSNNDFKALILEYMPKGSLEDHLHSTRCHLDIVQRLNIMVDVASALEYLHFGHSITLVHCDLKPSNVLLVVNMVAHQLSDFGISKLLNEDQHMTQTKILATIGYMAPKYGREGQVSTKGDVYTYGIMLMKTITRKKPTNENFSGEMSLKLWVNDMLPISVMNVMDSNLLCSEDKYFAAKEQSVSSILCLALECTSESPMRRMDTKEIVTRLLKIRDTLFANIEVVRA